MKTRVLSLSRKVAIAVCSALAVVTGTLSVAYPHLSGGKVQAADTYSDVGWSTAKFNLEYLPVGLDTLTTGAVGGKTVDQTAAVHRQIAQNISVTADGNPVPADDINIEGLSYNNNAYAVTYTISGATGSGTLEKIPAQTVTYSDVKVEVDENAARKNADDIYKILDGAGNLTQETLFLAQPTYRPSSEILDYLTVSYSYGTIAVPVIVVTENKPANQLGVVDAVAITKNQFAEGDQTVEVSVDNGSDYRTGTLPAVFEGVKIVNLTATPNDGVKFYTDTDVASNITVKATYNYADPATKNITRALYARDLTAAEFSVDNSLFPELTDIDYEGTVDSNTLFGSTDNNGNTVSPDSASKNKIEGISTHQNDNRSVSVRPEGLLTNRTVTLSQSINRKYLTAQAGRETLGQGTITVNGNQISATTINEKYEEIPTTYSSRITYDKSITISAGGVSVSVPFNGITLANPYEFKGIVGVLQQQEAGRTLNLNGLYLSVSYVTEFTDHCSIGITENGGAGGDIGNNLDSTIIKNISTKNIPLEEFASFLQVSFDGINWVNYTKELTIPGANEDETKPANVYFAFNYIGNMFFYVNGQESMTGQTGSYNGNRWTYQNNWLVTRWTKNDDFANATLPITYTDGNTGTETQKLQFARPTVDTSFGAYSRDGVTRSILNYSTEENRRYPVGTTVTIKREGVAGELVYTYTQDGNNFGFVTNTSDPATTFGIRLAPADAANGLLPRFIMTEVARYNVSFELPETSDGKDCVWLGDETNQPYTFTLRVTPASLGVAYFGALSTVTGLAARQGTLRETLERLEIRFTSNGSFIDDANILPRDYSLYIRPILNGTPTSGDAADTINGYLLQQYVGGVKQNVNFDFSKFENMDIAGSRFALHVVVPANDYFSALDTLNSYVTLEVSSLTPSEIADPTSVYFRPDQTAETVTANWATAFGGNYIVEIANASGPVQTGVLHAGNYTLNVYAKGADGQKLSDDPIRSVTYIVHAVVYTAPSAEYKPEDAEPAKPLIYGAINAETVLSDLKGIAKDAFNAVKDSVYYTFDADTANVTFRPKAGGNTVDNIALLTAGDWVAVFKTKEGTIWQKGDYNLPEIEVSFTVSKATVDVSLSGDFTEQAGVYTATYNYSGLKATVNGWEKKYQSDIAIEVTGTAANGGAITSVVATDNTYDITLFVAGDYTITVRATSENVTLTGTLTYNLTIEKAEAELAEESKSISVNAGTFALPDNIVINGVNGAIGEGLAINEYTLTEKGKTDPVTAVEYGKTYTLTVNSLKGNLVKASDNFSLLPYGYEVCYNYTEGEWTIAVTVVQTKLPNLQIRDKVAGGENPLKPREEGGAVVKNSYTLSATFGNTIDLSIYFSNAAEDSNYTVSYTKNSTASSARSAREIVTTDGSEEGLVLPDLGAGNWTVTISHSSNSKWDTENQADDVTIALTIDKQQVEKPSVDVVTKTYNGANQTITLGAASAFEYITATVYRFATNIDTFTKDDSNVVENAFANGTLTLHNAGNYWIVFALKDPANYCWTDKTFADLDAAAVAVVNRLTVEAPELGSARVWPEADKDNATFANGSVTADGKTFNYTVVTDKDAKTFSITMSSVTGDSVENYVWVQNPTDTQGMQYLTSYGTFDFDASNASVAKLNYAIAETLALNYTNQTPSIVYGGTFTYKDNDVDKTKTLATEADLDLLFGYVPVEGVTPTKTYSYIKGNSELVSNASAETAINAMKAASAGEYTLTIHVEFPGTNYTPMSFPIRLTVTPKPITVTVTATVKYGAVNFELSNLNVVCADVTLSEAQITALKGALVLNSAGLNAAQTAYNYDKDNREWATYAQVSALSDYSISISTDSRLTVNKETTNVSVDATYIYGESVDGLTGEIDLTNVPNYLNVVFGAENVNATGTIAYSIANGKVVLDLDLSTLESTNYEFTANEGNVTFNAVDVTVEIASVAQNYTTEGDLKNTLTYTPSVTSTSTVSGATITLNEEELRALISLSSEALLANGTNKVGKYSVSATFNENGTNAKYYNVIFTNNNATLYSVDFEISADTIEKTANTITYNGGQQQIARVAIKNPDSVPTGCAIFYACLQGDAKPDNNTVWSTQATAVNAGDYKVYYYIDIPNYGRVNSYVADKTDDFVTVTVAPDENTIVTGLLFGNTAVSSEQGMPTEAWNYGSFALTVTAPVSEYANNGMKYIVKRIQDAAGKEVNEECATDITNIATYFAQNANKFAAGLYEVSVITADDEEPKNFVSNKDNPAKYYFTVGKATLTVKADDVTKTYNGEAWDIASATWSVTGLKNGEEKDILTGKVTVVLTGEEGKNFTDAGKHGIIASLSFAEGITAATALENYTIVVSEQDGTLTINPRELTVFIPSVRVSFGTVEDKVVKIVSGLQATCVSGTIIGEGLTINDLISLTIDGGLAYTNGVLSTGVGKHAIYASWKTDVNNKSYGINYTLSFSGCDWDGSDISNTGALGGGARGTAGTFTIEKMILNATWTKQDAYVFTGSAIAVTAQATAYVDANGNTVDLPNAITLKTSWQKGSFVKDTNGNDVFTPFTGEDAETGVNSTPINAGLYKIFAEPFDGNYTTAGAFIIVRIDKAQATLTVGNATMNYGDALPTNNITLTAAGILEADNDKDDVIDALQSLTGKTFAVFNNEVKIINVDQQNVGTYTLTLEQTPVTDNYTVIVRDGALTINRRAVTITLDDMEAQYTGEAWDQTALSTLEISTDKVGNIPSFLTQGENGATIDKVSVNTFNVTLAPADAIIINAGTYNIIATASNTGNYIVKFAVADGEETDRKTTTLEITKVDVTITETVHVVFGETTVKEVDYVINNAVNGENYDELLRLTQTVTAAGGHTLYVVNNRTYTLTRTEGVTYTATPIGEISFLNYNVEVTGYITNPVVVEQREITASTTAEFEYRGAFGPEFTFAGTVSDFNDITANLTVTITKDSAPVDQIGDVGTYKVTLALIGNYATAYKLAQSEFTVTVTPKVIDVRWEKESIPEFNPNASAADRINTIIPVNAEDKATIWSLINQNLIAFAFTRSYTPYTVNPDGTYTKGDSVTVPITNRVDDEAKAGVGIMIEAIGSYTATLTLTGENAANYSFGDSATTWSNSFNVFTHTVTMNIQINQDGYEYDAYPVEIAITTDDSNIENGTVTRTDTFATITEAQANALSALTEITSADVESLSFRTYTNVNDEGKTVYAPVDAGYYVIHVSYLNETPVDGTLGADGYAVFRIKPKFVTEAPEWVVDRDEQGNAPQFSYQVSEGEAQEQQFVYSITDESLIAAYEAGALEIRVFGTKIGSSQEISSDYIAVAAEIKDNKLFYTVTVTQAGNYTVTFILTSENYQWYPLETDMEGSNGGIPTNDAGNYEAQFTIVKGNLDFAVNGATENTINLTFGDDYEAKIKEAMNYTPAENVAKVVSIEFFTNQDGNYVAYPQITAAGTYSVHILVEASDNMNLVEKTFTLVVGKKTVTVTANVSAVFGSALTFNMNSFGFDGFVNGENAGSILTVDFDNLAFTLDKTGHTSKYSDHLNVGTYRGILSFESMAAFTPSGTEDNYEYVFDAANSVVTITPLAITVTVGNASSPYGAPVSPVIRNTQLTTENTLPEQSDRGLATLLAVSFSGVTDSSYAGSYRINTTANNPNYNVTFEGGIYTITPVAVTIVISAGGGVYGGTIERAHIQAVSEGLNPVTFERDIIFYYEGTTYAGDAYARSTRLPSLAGSYTVTAVINPNAPDNFTLVGSVSRVFTIDKMTLDTSKLSMGGKTYTGNAFTPVVTIDEEFAENYASRFETDGKSFTNAGSYTVTLSVLDAANVQFTGGSSTYRMTFVVDKASNGVSRVDIEDWTYNGSPSAPTAVLEKTEGYDDNGPVITYEYRVNGEWTTAVPTAAGTYLVRAQVASSTNYNACVSGGYEFTINKMVLDVPTLNIIKEGEGKNDTYTGSTLLASVNDYNATTMTLSYGDSFNIEGNKVTLSALTVGGYMVHIALLDSNNYAWAESALVKDGVVELVWDVAPMRISAIPTENTDKFTVDGTILTYIPVGFDERYMKLGGDYQTGHSGKFKVKVDLIDNVNYTWADGTIGTITFDWEVGGVHNVFIGIVSGLSSVALVAGIAIVAQVCVHKKKLKQAEAEREARSNESDNAGNGTGEEV